MVRRWSHINNINEITYDNKNFFLFKKKYKLVNFKNSVSLKRFNKKYTKFKRKAFNRIKHVKNWFIYHNVFKFWSHDYLFVKHYYKFQFLNNIFLKNFLFYNFNFLKNFNTNIYYNWNFLFFNLKKNIYFYFNSFVLTKTRYNLLTNNHLNSFSWFFSFPTVDHLTVPFYTYSSNDLFPIILKNKKISFNINYLLNSINSIIYKKIILYYQNFIFLLL